MKRPAKHLYTIQRFSNNNMRYIYLRAAFCTDRKQVLLSITTNLAMACTNSFLMIGFGSHISIPVNQVYLCMLTHTKGQVSTQGPWSKFCTTTQIQWTIKGKFLLTNTIQQNLWCRTLWHERVSGSFIHEVKMITYQIRWHNGRMTTLRPLIVMSRFKLSYIVLYLCIVLYLQFLSRLSTQRGSSSAAYLRYLP